MLYRFGPYAVDDDTRQLLRDGEEIHVTPKAFELLDLLLVDRARAVSKAELQQRMWPSTFVEETNLASLVAEIRRVLGDSAANPSFVRTVYGFGYRFVGDVSVDPGAPVHEQRNATLWLTFERRHIPLMQGANVIGRAPDATVPIESPGISRYHARIVVKDGEATLEDLRSKNGTHLNGKRVAMPTRLTDGNQIGIGAVVLTFQTRPQISQTETMPASGS